MNSLSGLCFALLCLSNVFCATFDDKQTEECLKRYKSGGEVDMKNVLGEWYPIYHWPLDKVRYSENCAKATFKEVSAADIKDCKYQMPENEPIIEMTYVNGDVVITRYMYGAGDAKTLVDCGSDTVEYKVIHSDLGNGKLLAALCPTGSVVLLSRNLISAAELGPVVEGVDVMKGINGASECKLP